MMRTISIAVMVVIFTLGLGVSLAQMPDQQVNGGTHDVDKAPLTQRVQVQVVARPDPLTQTENVAIADYLAQYGPRMSAQNRLALQESLCFLLGIHQSHLPLNRKPVDYLADYQTVTQMYKMTDFYANVPVYQPPVFVPAAPAARIEPLCLEDVEITPLSICLPQQPRLEPVCIADLNPVCLEEPKFPCVGISVPDETCLERVSVRPLPHFVAECEEAVTAVTRCYVAPAVESAQKSGLRATQLPTSGSRAITLGGAAVGLSECPDCQDNPETCPIHGGPPAPPPVSAASKP